MLNASLSKGDERSFVAAVLSVGCALFFTFKSAAASPDVDSQVATLLSQMTLDEKIGQMTQTDLQALKDKSDVQKYYLGSVLSGGGHGPKEIDPQGWLKACTELEALSRQTRLKIPILYGIDAVHGHNNVEGAVIFPHNIGMGATRNPALVEKAARVVAEEVAGTGIQWVFAPCIAVARNERWGRTYESFGESPELVGEMGAAEVRGFQGNELSPASPVLACAKHFLADGGTTNGIDQGNAVCDEATLRKVFLTPYLPAIRAGVGSIMPSYSSWNGVKMHANKYLLTDVLKGELGFKGFLISDWAAIDEISSNYEADVAASVNAGLDMVMVPYGPGEKNNYVEFIDDVKKLVADGTIPQSRIDDAVTRILRIKIQMGLFDRKPVDPALTASIGSPEHREVARECVRQSLVLLKNSRHALPLPRNARHLVVVGAAADDLGIQCGGWTISWQGEAGQPVRGGTSILAAIRNAVGPNTEVTFSPRGDGIQNADAVVVVVGEPPYAEMKGDRKSLRLSDKNMDLVAKARESGAPVVTLLLSGRPLILGSALDMSDAVLAAWLPGSEGEGVADVLFGDYRPSGKLSRAWPVNDGQVAVVSWSGAKPQFPCGFGLTYDAQSARRTAATAAITGE